MGHEVIGNNEIIEELKENVVYVMENLNFIPDEHSYVEPWKENAEMPMAEPEKKADEGQNEDSQRQGKPGAKNEKKLSAAEKQKLEEEAKRKAEEDSKAALEWEASRLERERLAKIKEEERQRRLEEEYFDAQTTYKYLKNLGKPMGQIYVNDAPLACLTTSNSVAEIKSDKKVMGLKMTEDLRKLC
jgi:hypothetical protein